MSTTPSPPVLWVSIATNIEGFRYPGFPQEVVETVGVVQEVTGFLRPLQQSRVTHVVVVDPSPPGVHATNRRVPVGEIMHVFDSWETAFRFGERARAARSALLVTIHNARRAAVLELNTALAENPPVYQNEDRSDVDASDDWIRRYFVDRGSVYDEWK